MQRADIVLVNGEGTIHQDRPAGKALVSVADYCASLGKPSVLLNASWYSNGPDLSASARQFAIVSARESESERQMQAAGIQCRRMADLALYGEIAASPRTNRIGVTDSVRGAIALELDHLRRSMNADIVNLFYGQTGISGLRFFLRHFGFRQAIGKPLVMTGIIRAALAFQRRQTSDTDDFLALVSRLKLLITGRFHAAIFALASLTPLVAIESNTPKISATLRDAGVAPWRVCSLDALDMDLVRSAEQWHKDEEVNIRDYLSDNRSRQAQLFKDIAALAS